MHDSRIPSILSGKFTRHYFLEDFPDCNIEMPLNQFLGQIRLYLISLSFKTLLLSDENNE